MRDLPKNVYRRTLKSGRVVLQYEQRISVRSGGRRVHKQWFRRSLGDDLADIERQLLIARAEYQETKRQVEDQVLGLSNPDPWTVQRFAEEVWTFKYRETNNAVNTEVAMNRYKKYIDPIIGGLEPAEVTVSDVDRVRSFACAYRLPNGKVLSLATQRQIMLLVKGILRRMQIRGLILQSPFFHEEHLPKVKKTTPRPLRADQMKEILAPGALTKPWHAFVVRLGLTTGFRKSDMLALRWSHIDEENERVGPIKGKGGKIRYIPLTDPLRVVLAWWKKNGGSGGFSDGAGVTDWVLPTRNSDSFKWVERTWPREQPAKGPAKKRLSFRWNLHQTRHTFACAYLDGGGRLKALSQILGHGSTKTTEIYATIAIGGLVRESVKVLNQILAEEIKIDPQTYPHAQTAERSA